MTRIWAGKSSSRIDKIVDHARITAKEPHYTHGDKDPAILDALSETVVDLIFFWFDPESLLHYWVLVQFALPLGGQQWHNDDKSNRVGGGYQAYLCLIASVGKVDIPNKVEHLSNLWTEGLRIREAILLVSSSSFNDAVRAAFIRYSGATPPQPSPKVGRPCQPERHLQNDWSGTAHQDQSGPGYTYSCADSGQRFDSGTVAECTRFCRGNGKRECEICGRGGDEMFGDFAKTNNAAQTYKPDVHDDTYVWNDPNFDPHDVWITKQPGYMNAYTTDTSGNVIYISAWNTNPPPYIRHFKKDLFSTRSARYPRPTRISQMRYKKFAVA